jgi:GST-like protein
MQYEAIPVDTRKGDQHKPEFLAINPNAKVPAIVDGDVTVFDSSAILIYLAEKTGKFLPAKTDRARGELLSWMFFVSSGVGPYSGQSVHFRVYAPEKLPYAINRYAFEAQRHFGILEGLGAADAEHPGRGRLGQVPEPQAHGRRGHGAACGAEGHDAQGPAPVQG